MCIKLCIKALTYIKCRTHSWAWAMLRQCVTSGTGLTLTPDCRCRTEAVHTSTKCGRAGCNPLHCLQCGCVYSFPPTQSLLKGRNAGLSWHPVSAVPVQRLTKLLISKPVRYRNKRTQSEAEWFVWTKMSYTGMPIPAALVSIPICLAMAKRYRCVPKGCALIYTCWDHKNVWRDHNIICYRSLHGREQTDIPPPTPFPQRIPPALFIICDPRHAMLWWLTTPM